MDPAQIIEAILFVSDAPLTHQALLAHWEHEEFREIPLDAATLDDILENLVKKYQDPAFAFEVRQVNGGYQFYSKKEFFPWVRLSAMTRQNKKLGRSAMETLSIIAYRQPVTKAELEFIRGVGCDYALSKLLDKKLIDIKGRSEAPGRPLLYGTSEYFMEHFGLNKLSDLPKLEEFEQDEDEYQAQFKMYMDDKSAENETENDENT